MIRYEASLNGEPVIGEPFTDFNELAELEKSFQQLDIQYELIRSGRGGYYLFDVQLDENRSARIHIYLKRITFGGRETRPYEKRAQFSGSIDRTGFNTEQTSEEFSLILGIYKSYDFEDKVFCAWKIDEWGHNEGHAFNCFVNVLSISTALRSGSAVQKSALNQITNCFREDLLLDFLIDQNVFIEENEGFDDLVCNQDQYKGKDTTSSEIPPFPKLFNLLLVVLRENNGLASVDFLELEVANLLNLSEESRFKIHNRREGRRTVLGYRLAWARFYLKKAGILINSHRGIWELTAFGWTLSEIDVRKVIKEATRNEISEEVKNEDYNFDEDSLDIEEESDEDNVSIENPFDPNLVDIRTKTMSLDLLIKRLRNYEIDMNTNFQRQANLWNITKQSRLIESILVRFPLPAFYFDGSDDNNWLVVDGLQRLSSLDNFINKQNFTLQNLEFLKQFEGIKFSELPGYLQRRIEEFEITAYIIASGTPKVLKFNVFKRINTGGLTLTSQEIRNALNQGVASNFVRELANLRSFKEATSFAIPSNRMLDQEFVTRFIAFYLTDYENYRPDLDTFLNEAMDRLSDAFLDRIMSDFGKAMIGSMLIFENDAFRKRFSKNDKRKPINKALFEVWSVLLSKCTSEEIDKLVVKKEELRNKFINLLNSDDDFNKAISSATGDRKRVRKRFTEIDKIINSTLDHYS